MRKRTVICLISLAAFNSTAILLGEVQPAAPPPNPSASATSAPAASQPAASPPLPPADNSGIAPTALSAVKNIMEHPQAWQKAVQGLMDKIDDPQLRQQLSEGLSNLTPQIARGLLDYRGDTAYATVAVYRQAGEAGKQAAVALAFEGFGGRLDATFYGRVLADMPRPPDAVDSASPKGLVLDAPASCYLCFFLSADGLCAGAIPHETFKQELAAAFQQAGKTPPNVVADGEQAIQEAAIHGWLDQVVRQDVIQQQQAQVAAEEASATYGPGYNALVAVEPYPPYYYGDWGLYGAGWYNPILIVLHRPLHHNGEGHHWQNWNWRPYRSQLHSQPNTPANSVTAAPPVIIDNASLAPGGQTVSPPNVPVEPYQPQPVFSEPSRPPAASPSNPPAVSPSNPPAVSPSNPPAVSPSNPPAQQATPARSSGTRTGGGASGGSRATGGSGGARGGGGPAHR